MLVRHTGFSSTTWHLHVNSPFMVIMSAHPHPLRLLPRAAPKLSYVLPSPVTHRVKCRFSGSCYMRSSVVIRHNFISNSQWLNRPWSIKFFVMLSTLTLRSTCVIISLNPISLSEAGFAHCTGFNYLKILHRCVFSCVSVPHHNLMHAYSSQQALPWQTPNNKIWQRKRACWCK